MRRLCLNWGKRKRREENGMEREKGTEALEDIGRNAAGMRRRGR